MVPRTRPQVTVFRDGRLDQDTDLTDVRTALAARYRIQRWVGQGAFARVYLATDLKHDRAVAVKVLKPEWTEAIARQRFLREIRVTAQLNHPNILPLLDSGEMGGFLYYVMPFVEGQTLRQRLQREKQLPVDDAVRITREVASGLAAAHAEGILHRDVKPENILLHGGRAMVADFGIAKAFTDAGVDTLTSARLGIGTPGYMSPEQAAGELDLDPRSDIYSLACVTYEMLSGEPPYTGPSAQAVIAKTLHLAVPSVRVLRGTIAPAVDRVLQKALAKVPADRPATMAEFIDSLTDALTPESSSSVGGPASPLRRLVREHPGVTTLGVVVGFALGGWALWTAVRPPPAVGGPPSVAVIAYHTATSSAEEQRLAGELAEAITRELNRWDPIRAVPAVSLAGPMFDLGLRGPTLENIGDGVRVARAVSVRTMMAVVVHVQGDSVVAEANVVNVSRGRMADRPLESTALRADLDAVARSLVASFLGLDAANADPVQLRKLSSYPEAIMADMEGSRELEHGRLHEAERAFRRAIAVDSGFALAQHHLARSLYWEAYANPRQQASLGPEIARLSTAAQARAAGLSRRDSLHIVAFHSFQAGDYDAARAIYRDLLAADPTDVDALLMRSTVESRDPWLVRRGDGSLVPRGNLNVATRDVAEILRLRPTFDLGYDNLAEALQKVDVAADRGTCQGFEIPRNQVRLPWDPGSPEQQRSFCPIVQGDSIAWVSVEAFAALDRAEVRAGARQFFERYLALVRRWALYAEHERRPREAMVSALLSQRRRLDVAAPEQLAALADSALRFAESAVALMPDTTPDDLVRLAGLRLGIGAFDAAARQTAQALRASTEPDGRWVGTPNTVAANALMASGQPLRAMEILSGAQVRRFLPDPGTGALIPFGGAEPVLLRIQVLGATGTGGDVLRRELANLRRVWADSRYSERQRRLLRENVTVSIATALVLDSAALREWGSGVTVSDPLWHALLESSRDSARAHAALDSAMSGGAGDALQSFLQGLVAARLGDHRLAITRFSRIDSLPLRLDRAETGWGLLRLSQLRRAQSYEALGDAPNARIWYESFQELRATADTAGRLLVEEATRGLARLGKSS